MYVCVCVTVDVVHKSTFCGVQTKNSPRWLAASMESADVCVCDGGVRTQLIIPQCCCDEFTVFQTFQTVQRFQMVQKVCVCVCVRRWIQGGVCVEWVLHTTHGVYGIPTSGHT